MKNLMDMMKQAREIQSKVAEVQADLESLEVEGVSGGGLVTVRMNGKAVVTRLSIDPGLLKPEEKEILEDLILAAYSDARQKAEKAMAEKMQALTGGLPLPPGMKLF